MADLLLELLSEEIPARMQEGAARAFERLVAGGLSGRGLLFEGIKSFAGPRRLSLAVSGLPMKQPDGREEVKGPKIAAAAKAIDGFLSKVGLRKDQLRIEKAPKGDVYIATILRPGRETASLLAEILPQAMAQFPWPKSMRWKPGVAARWVRPLHSILCTFDGEVVPFSFAGVSSGSHTRGHRFLAPGRVELRRFDNYVIGLRKAHVVLDAEERAAMIFEAVKQAAFVHGLEMVEDAGLLAEVAGLVEWPVVLVGTVEAAFMNLPAEILQTSMRMQQKYFALREPLSGRIASRFALVANMVAEDGGREIVAGNERVLRARLADAKFFWDEDLKRTLESRVEALKGVVFHARLGTQYERVERIAALAEEIASKIGADPKKAERAARLCKADLTSGVVGEFPGLQGVIGRYYALHDGEDSEIADAIRDHYKPMGPSDAIAGDPVSVCVALADKLDTLTGFFAAGEKPTGSGDPFALRRAALGVIRIILERRLRLSLAVSQDLLSFLADRLKIALKEKGVPHDMIDAVFALTHDDDLVRLVDRVEALQAFLNTEDGANLLKGYKRAANILKVEEKRDQKTFSGEVEEARLFEPGEKALHAALSGARSRIAAALEREDFGQAMHHMAALRVPVDAFFDSVKVNAEAAEIRENRLRLLASLRAVIHRIGDFSRIEGHGGKNEFGT
ncbi:MAG: glycine--tRNA ligase subunit beta [Rhizomicrobium sp.]